MQSFFDHDSLEQLAQASGFVKKESTMTGAKFAQLCIGGVTERGLMGTLGELCTAAQKLGAHLCEQSLNERFNPKAVGFLKKLFEKAMSHRIDGSALEVLGMFAEVVLEDSTVVELPENLAQVFPGSGGFASRAAVKVDLTYGLKASNFTLRLRRGNQPDGSVQLPLSIAANSLWLRDLGYFRLSDFEKIGLAGGYYISRLKSDVKVYLSDSGDAVPLDLLQAMKKMKAGQVRDMQVFIGKEKRLAARMVLQRVPKGVAEEKRRKLKKEKRQKRKTVTGDRLEFCGLNAFITNLGTGQWPPRLVMRMYKVRWQVEILFKVWKSILKIGQVQKMKADRFMCLFYAQLTWAMVNMRVFQSFKNHFWNTFAIEISELKSFKVIRSFHKELLGAIWKNQKRLYEECLDGICCAIARFGKKQYKKHNPNPLFTCENL
jgi:hypothetical protein